MDRFPQFESGLHCLTSLCLYFHICKKKVILYIIIIIYNTEALLYSVEVQLLYRLSSSCSSITYKLCDLGQVA